MKYKEHNAPPGDDIGGKDLRRRTQDGGYGASGADIKRGHKKPKVELERYENVYPQRGDPFSQPAGGFLRRSGISDER